MLTINFDGEASSKRPAVGISVRPLFCCRHSLTCVVEFISATVLRSLYPVDCSFNSLPANAQLLSNSPTTQVSVRSNDGPHLICNGHVPTPSLHKQYNMH